MLTIKTFAAASLAMAAATMPLSTAHASEGRTVEVGYADLDLSSKAGQQIFDRRIETAIEKVCGRMENHPALDSGIRKCQQQTRASAMRSRNLAVANYGNTRLAGSETRTIRFAAR